MADARSRAASVLQTFQQAVLQTTGSQVCLASAELSSGMLATLFMAQGYNKSSCAWLCLLLAVYE